MITLEHLGDLLTSEWLPAWVQAFGSIAAIAAAGLLIFVQHALERDEKTRREQEDRGERLQALLALIEAIQDDLEREVNFIGRQRVEERSVALDLIRLGSSRVAGYLGLLNNADLSFVRESKIWYAAAQLRARMGAFEQTAILLMGKVERFTPEDWRTKGREECQQELVNMLEEVRFRADFAYRIIDEHAQ